MSITSNLSNINYKKTFIFRENSIILQNKKLPNENTIKRCFEMDVATDWISEIDEDKNYSAIFLEKDSPNPKDCEDIPLREFAYSCQNDEESKKLASLAFRAKGLLHFHSKTRFCSVCGKSLKLDEKLVAKKCPKCKNLIFPRIEPAIIVLINKGDEYLLAKHAQRNQDVYTCLAGFVETGETIEAAVHREIMEETGIKVKNLRYVASQSWPFPDQLMFAFRAEYDSGEIKIQKDELQDARWFNKNDLPNIPPAGSVAHNLITGVFG